MPGKIALVGGNEFRPNCEAMDLALLAGIARPPRVCILPTAARENPHLAAQNGIRHFRRLGAEAREVGILNERNACDPRYISLLAEADIFYVAGGDPVYLLKVFKDSPAWTEMVRLWREGRLIAGSSAGAMILGEKMWDPAKGWREGLGLLPGLAVLPHRAVLAARWNVEEMLRTLPASFTLAGIDEATSLMGPPWRVFGIGEVALYRAGDISGPPRVFKTGEEVILPGALQTIS